MRLFLLIRHIQQSNCLDSHILSKGLDHIGSSPLSSLDFSLNSRPVSNIAYSTCIVGYVIEN